MEKINRNGKMYRIDRNGYNGKNWQSTCSRQTILKLIGNGKILKIQTYMHIIK
jgi:hypothetical protein